MDGSAEKPWSGRFDKPSDSNMERFNASIGFDRRLYRADIAGSRAQAKALAKIGVLTAEELERVLDGLDQVEAEIAGGPSRPGLSSGRHPHGGRGAADRNCRRGGRQDSYGAQPERSGGAG